MQFVEQFDTDSLTVSENSLMIRFSFKRWTEAEDRPQWRKSENLDEILHIEIVASIEISEKQWKADLIFSEKKRFADGCFTRGCNKRLQLTSVADNQENCIQRHGIFC